MGPVIRLRKSITLSVHPLLFFKQESNNGKLHSWHALVFVRARADRQRAANQQVLESHCGLRSGTTRSTELAKRSSWALYWPLVIAVTRDAGDVTMKRVHVRELEKERQRG